MFRSSAGSGDGDSDSRGWLTYDKFSNFFDTQFFHFHSIDLVQQVTCVDQARLISCATLKHFDDFVRGHRPVTKLVTPEDKPNASLFGPVDSRAAFERNLSHVPADIVSGGSH
jgi:hypothetical protein